MSGYRFRDSCPADPSQIVYTTHPCQPGTSIVWLGSDRTRRTREPVMLWGVLGDCRLVPITVGGIWGGTEDSPGFIRLPDGTCTRDGTVWDSEEDAVDGLAEHDHADAA